MKRVLASAVAAVALTASMPAMAASISWVSTTPSNAGGVTVSTFGYTINNGTTNTTVNSTSPISGSSIVSYQQGLGVYNSAVEDINTNEHAIDNRDGYDFIVLQFSNAVQLTGMTLNAFPLSGNNNVADKDAWVSYTNVNLSSSSTSTIFGDLLGNKKDYASANGADGTFPAFTNIFSKTWVIGAALSSADRDDAFKLAGITYNIQAAVPEPATWMTMILGFGAIGGALRRRRRTALATA